MYSILLVDDEKTIREYLPKAIPFEDHGFKVKDTAMNGQEAIDKLSIVKPDLILLDVRMPIMDGLKFLNALRQSEFSNTLVVMLSGYSDFEYAKEAMKYGVEAYLNKPVDEDEILPLLEKMHKKLDEYNNKMSIGLARKHVNKLNNLYNGVEIERQIFSGHTLMTCVLLPSSKDYKNENPHIVIQECLSKVLGEPENYLFRIQSSQYTYLLPPKVFETFNNNKRYLTNNILETLKEKKIECSILFDSYVFKHPEGSFREDFTNHMCEMLTELFFSPTEFMDYDPKQFKISYKLCQKCKLLDEINQHFSLRNKEELLKAVETLISEIQKAHLEINHIQEITSRLYYIIQDKLTVEDNEDENENKNKANLVCPELLDSPFFVSFKKWREMLVSLVLDGLAFIERRCKIMNLGVSREVIEYVDQHFMEQISLKQIADKFYVNATYLGRAFQKATGVNFKQYVNDIRIEEAKKLLLHTDKLIYEIAKEVGYAESKYFIVKFIQEVGKSPTEYRNQI